MNAARYKRKVSHYTLICLGMSKRLKSQSCICSKEKWNKEAFFRLKCYKEKLWCDSKDTPYCSSSVNLRTIENILLSLGPNPYRRCIGGCFKQQFEIIASMPKMYLQIKDFMYNIQYVIYVQICIS